MPADGSFAQTEAQTATDGDSVDASNVKKLIIQDIEGIPLFVIFGDANKFGFEMGDFALTFAARGGDGCVYNVKFCNFSESDFEVFYEVLEGTPTGIEIDKCLEQAHLLSQVMGVSINVFNGAIINLDQGTVAHLLNELTVGAEVEEPQDGVQSSGSRIQELAAEVERLKAILHSEEEGDLKSLAAGSLEMVFKIQSWRSFQHLGPSDEGPTTMRALRALEHYGLATASHQLGWQASAAGLVLGVLWLTQRALAKNAFGYRNRPVIRGLPSINQREIGANAALFRLPDTAISQALAKLHHANLIAPVGDYWGITVAEEEA